MNGATILLRAITMVLTMGVATGANARLFGSDGTSWREEAELHDGSKVIVERSIERRGRHEIGQRPGATHETLTFAMPGTGQTIVWEDKFSEDVQSSNFNLLMLGVKDGLAYLVATPMGCLSYNKWGRPNPPYVVFKYQSNDWQRIALQELPSGLKAPNLVISSPDDAAAKTVGGVVPAEVVRSLNSTARQSEYKMIIREPLPKEQILEMCEERVLYRGYWMRPDDPVAKRIIDRRVESSSQIKGDR